MEDATQLKQEVWSKAVKSLEDECMRVLPTLPGGRKSKESVEEYADRCVGELSKSLRRLNVARSEMGEVAPVIKSSVGEYEDDDEDEPVKPVKPNKSPQLHKPVSLVTGLRVKSNKVVQVLDNYGWPMGISNQQWMISLIRELVNFMDAQHRGLKSSKEWLMTHQLRTGDPIARVNWSNLVDNIDELIERWDDAES